MRDRRRNDPTSPRAPANPDGRGRMTIFLLATVIGILILAVGLALVTSAQPLGAIAGWWGESAFRGDAGHGQRLAQAKCASCHGADGNSAAPQIPKLAGQNPNYLYSQLWAFHSGARQSSIMANIVAALSDADADDLAKYYSEQVRAPDRVSDRGLAAQGRRVFYTGASTWTTSRCAMCHDSAAGVGMMGRGMMGMMGTANAPDLNGQHAAYILDQLNRFASGQRQGTVMNRIAVAINPTDRKAVAEYLSGRR